jgi:hypothetical protein
MSTEKSIIDNLSALGRGKDKTFIATVVENYPDKDIVDVKDLSGTLYPDVRKRSAIGNPDKGINITPAKNSTVLISRIGESDELFIAMFSEIESIKIDGGYNAGLVKVIKLTERLNLIEKSINELKNYMKSWVPATGDGGAALKTIASTWSNEPLSETDKAIIENEKIKH